MRLLAITPPRALAPRLDARLVEAWVAAGARSCGLYVLLREPRAHAADILADCRLLRLREALAAHDIPALVSVDPHSLEPEAGAHIVRSAGLAGVQLRGDPSVELCQRWRAALGSDLTLGRSAHGFVPEPSPGVNYTCLAPIHAPRTQLPGEAKSAIGLEALRSWAAACPHVIALGGISTANARACLEAGAHGLAGIRLFFGPHAEAGHNVRALADLIQLFSEGQDDDAPQAPAR